MRAGLLLTLLIGSVLSAPTTASASSESGSCSANVSLRVARASCATPKQSARSSPARNRAVVRYVQPACAVKLGALCGRKLPCITADGRNGTVVNTWLDGVRQGRTCEANPEGAPATAPGPTPADVASEWKRLDWPTPTLVVQPPDGTTLVNLATNAYTPDPGPLTQTTTLLTQQVTIEATPTSYTWDFGDGPPLTTTDPGAPYPALRITHTYRRTGTYNLTLTTTLSGRYRIADGPWQPIPGTLTLTTPAQPLRAVEATPRLVKP